MSNAVSKPSMPMGMDEVQRTNITAGLVVSVQVTMGTTEMDTLTELLTNMANSGALNPRERMVAEDFTRAVDDVRSHRHG